MVLETVHHSREKLQGRLFWMMVTRMTVGMIPLLPLLGLGISHYLLD
jgi:hypothetical protein